MSMAAYRAYYPADGHMFLAGWSSDRALIGCMEGKTAGMTAGTLKLMKLEACYYRIVKLLRKCIEILDGYC